MANSALQIKTSFIAVLVLSCFALFSQSDNNKGVYFSWGLSTGLVFNSYNVQSNYNGDYRQNESFLPLGLNLSSGYRLNDKWELGLLAKASLDANLFESTYNTFLGANCSYYLTDRLSFGLGGGLNFFSDAYDDEDGFFLGLMTNYSLKRRKEKKCQFGLNGGVYFSKFQPNQDDLPPSDLYYREWSLTNITIGVGIYWRWD